MSCFPDTSFARSVRSEKLELRLLLPCARVRRRKSDETSSDGKFPRAALRAVSLSPLASPGGSKLLPLEIFSSKLHGMLSDPLMLVKICISWKMRGPETMG